MRFGISKATYDENTEQERELALTYAEMIQAQDEQKAKLMADYGKLRKEADQKLQGKTYYRKAVEAEDIFLRLCYDLAKLNAKLSQAPLSAAEISRMSVFDFFTLKTHLEKDLSDGRH